MVALQQNPVSLDARLLREGSYMPPSRREAARQILLVSLFLACHRSRPTVQAPAPNTEIAAGAQRADTSSTPSPSTGSPRVYLSAADAPPLPPGARVVPFERVVKRDSAGRTLANGLSIDRESNAAVDARNAAVRQLRVTPDRLLARIGDTIVPAIALDVSGRDSAGRYIPRVVPLFGPFRQDGVLKPLGDGRWLAVKTGEARVGVRVMRFAQRPSEDTALVRSVTVEVVR